MKYLEQLLDTLIKWEGDRLEISLKEPPCILKDEKKNFITKVPLTESEFTHIETELRDEFSSTERFIYKDRHITTHRTPEVRTYFLEKDGGEPFDLSKLLQLMVTNKASDLYLTSRCKPYMRIDGDMAPLADFTMVREEQMREELRKIVPPAFLQDFEYGNEICFAQEQGDRSRFRINIFKDRRGMTAAIRRIPVSSLSVSELGLPPSFVQLCSQRKGLILITGPCSSGKTTTLAALIDHINRNQKRHILVLEDPIEYLHWNKQSLVHQKEFRSYSDSLEKPLLGTLRSDADVVAIGELRDPRTLALAIEMASYGHLVIGVLQTFSVIGTIDRIIDLFHPTHKVHIRNLLAGCILGISSQALCSRKGGGRIAAFELLTSNAAVANIIREGKTFQLATLMQATNIPENRMLNDILVKYIETGVVEPLEALAQTYDPEGLKTRLKMKGIVI